MMNGRNLICLIFLCVLPLVGLGMFDGKLLDTLYAKKYISREELVAAKKELSAPVIFEAQRSQRFRLWTILQMRYSLVSQEYNVNGVSDAEYGRFSIRRLIPVFFGDISDDSRIIISMYMPSSRVINTAHYEIDLDTQILCGKFMFGLNAINFCTEELESGSRIMTPDRSILCMYFGGGDSGYDGYQKTQYGTALGFSGYHTGLFWNGWIPEHKELFYGVAITNSRAMDYDITKDNGLSFWLTAGYQMSGEDYSLRIGANSGYSTKLVAAIESGQMLPSPVYDCGDAFGINPFVRLTYSKFTLNAEFMCTRLEYGKSYSDKIALYTTQSDSATPIGFYALAAYKILDFGEWGEIEPVARYSYINSDGRGIRECDILYKLTCSNGLYNRVHAYYAGFNWYVRSNNLKYVVGFEHLDFVDSPTGAPKPRGTSDIFVAQMQLLF